MAPTLCANGCGFYGSAANNNLCSKCYKDDFKEQSENEGAEDESKKLINSIDDLSDLCAGLAPIRVTKEKKNRCESCNKKVGLTGFECRCGNLFCGKHRYPEDHSCDVNFKKIGRQALAKQNPKIVAEKLEYKI